MTTLERKRVEERRYPDFSRLDHTDELLRVNYSLDRSPLSFTMRVEGNTSSLSLSPFQIHRRLFFEEIWRVRCFCFYLICPGRSPSCAQGGRWAGDAVASAAISRPFQDTQPRKLVQSSALDRADALASPPLSSPSSSSYSSSSSSSSDGLAPPVSTLSFLTVYTISIEKRSWTRATRFLWDSDN